MLQFIWIKLRSASAWIADHEIFPLSLGVALATFTTRWAVGGLGLIAVLWLLRWLGCGRLTVRTSIDWPVCLLVLMIPITFYATSDCFLTFMAVSRLLAGLALVYGFANWAKRGAHVTLLAFGLVWGGLGLALAAPISVGWFTDVKPFVIPGHIYALFPTLANNTIHPNMLAGALVMLLPFPVALLLMDPSADLPSVVELVPHVVARILDRRWFRYLSCGAATLLMVTMLVLTKSRGGWIAACVILLLIFTYRWRYFLWVGLIGLVGIELLVWRGYLPVLLDRISSSGVISGWQGRLEIWSRALYMIQDFPFTGIGANTFNAIVDTFYPFFLAELSNKVGHAHNLLLQIAVDLGLPGLIAFLSIVIIACLGGLNSIRLYRRVNNNALELLTLAGIVSLVGMLVHGMLDATTWIIGRAAFIPFAVIGILIVLELGIVQLRPEIG